MTEAKSRYWLLLAFETVGALLIFWQGIGAYRRIAFEQIYEAGPPLNLVAYVTIGTIFIQIGYWANSTGGLQFNSAHHVLVGHIIVFLARLNFVFVGSLFGLTFFVRFDSIDFSAITLILMFVGLFSVFCYSRELERLGKALGA